MFVIFILSYQYKNAWPLTILTLAILLAYKLPIIFENVKFFRLGKDGIELETITKEAKSTIDTIKELTVLFSEKLSITAARTGRYSGGLNIKELYELKCELYNLLRKLDINCNMKNITKEIDKTIISDLFSMLVHNCKNKDASDKLQNYSHQYADISSIKIEDIKCLQDDPLFDEHAKIIDEMLNFQKDGQFEDKNFLTSISS
jgi:hypothetical protein